MSPQQLKKRSRNIWMNMKQRCLNSNSPVFKDYGGRGITICAKWFSYSGFAFDMGISFPPYTLDRVNNNDGYYKKNCRWATLQEQMRNKRNNVEFQITFEQTRKRPKKWRVRHSSTHGRKHLGYFETELEAMEFINLRKGEI